MLGKKKHSISKNKSFTLIETLVGVFLLAILSLGIFSAYAFGIKMSTQNRLRTQATAIAEKKIEAIRAINYEDIGTLGGIPSGQVPAEETEVEDGTSFSVRTNIRYIDDVYDNLVPQDPAPSDYKQIEVKVDWPTNLESKSITLNTLVSPPRIESNLGTGVLIINTVDSEGNPVGDCNVKIVNNDVSPTINLNTETDSSGSLTLPGVPSSSDAYEIEISKTGYETVNTYPPYPTSSYNPIDLHLSIAEGEITSKTFVIDKTSELSINFLDTENLSLPNVDFSLRGGRVIGTTVEAAPEEVYFYDQSNLNSGETGNWQQSGLGKGPYYFAVSSETHELITTSLPLPWPLSPDSSESVQVILGDKLKNILVIEVSEEGGETPIVEALVTIKDSLGNLFQETSTDLNGIAYFPKVEDPPKVFLPEETYSITITKEGYTQLDRTATVSGITRREEILLKE